MESQGFYTERELTEQEIREIEDSGSLVIGSQSDRSWVLSKSVRDTIGERAKRLERLSNIRERALKEKARKKKAFKKTETEERTIETTGRIIDNIIDTSLHADEKIYLNGKITNYVPPPDRDYRPHVGWLRLIVGEKSDGSLRREIVCETTGETYLGRLLSLAVYNREIFVKGNARILPLPWEKSLREGLTKEAYETFLKNELKTCSEEETSRIRFKDENEFKEHGESIRASLEESLATPYADREPRALPAPVREISEEQWKRCKGEGFKSADGISEKSKERFISRLKLGAKCAMLSLAYLGARAVAGADVHEVFGVDVPTSLLQAMDMAAYTVPLVLPIAKSYLESPRDLYNIDNIRDNPELGMRI